MDNIRSSFVSHLKVAPYELTGFKLNFKLKGSIFSCNIVNIEDSIMPEFLVNDSKGPSSENCSKN